MARKRDKVQINQLMHVTLTHPVDMMIDVDSHTYYYYTQYYNKRWKDSQKQALEYSDMTLKGLFMLLELPFSLNLTDSFPPHTSDMYPGISEVGFYEVLVNIEYITLCRCRSGVPLYGETP